MRSDIFEEFARIAQAKGLIASEHAEHTEKDFHETNPRMDSLSIEQIGKLYNNKPQSPKEMEYKKNIMEIAHPEPAILFQSHDKLNSLIENENEGQNIRMRIVMKTPDGQYNQRKYAEKQLILSLLRTANDLDNRGQEQLSKLADVCLEQASGKQFTKTAQWQLVVGGIAAAIGALYLKQHMNFHSDGWTVDYQKANAEIDDLLTSNSYYVVGVSYNPAFIQMVQQLKDKLGQLNAAVQKTLPILNSLEQPKVANDLKQIAASQKVQEATDAIKQLQSVFDEVIPFINTVIKNFSNEGFKQRATVSKGFMNSLVDATGLHGGHGLVSDDFDDVAHALGTLKGDIKNIADGLNAYPDAVAEANARLTQAKEESTKTFAPDASLTPETGTTPEAVATPETPWAKAEEALESLNPLKGK